MRRRSKLIETLVELVGSEAIEISDQANGWPAFGHVLANGKRISASIHVGPITLSKRGRDDVERRFQNPGTNRPVLAPAGFTPLLLGIWNETKAPILVGMSPSDRIGKLTRYSLFMPLHLLEAAAKSGWAEHFSFSGEKIVAFSPKLLPVFLSMEEEGVQLDPKHIESLVEASASPESDEGAERIRKSVSRLLRDATFSKKVCEAYAGLCAMCGLNYSLVVGAHIYPVAAPGSMDEVWNGLALCHNHHALFDSHRIHVDPGSFAITMHPEVLKGTTRSTACDSLVNGTFPVLGSTKGRHQSPRREMFEKRYRFFEARYDWRDI